MNRSLQCLVALVAAGAVLVAGLPEVEASRSASMAESRLIEDKNDIYLFPQVGVEHTQLLSVDYGIDSGSGGGIAILGDDTLSFGVGVYRGDLLSSNQFFPHAPGEMSLDNIGSPIPGSPDNIHTIGDFFVSTDLGAGLLGARVSVGSGGELQVNDEDEASLENGHTFGALTLGYSLVNELRLDTSLTTRFSSISSYDESIEDVDSQVGSEGSSFLIGTAVRAYIPMMEGVEIGALADIQYDMQSVTTLPDDSDTGTETRNSQFSGLAGAGPVYRIDDNTTIAGYGVLGYLRTSEESQDVEQEDSEVGGSYSGATVLPGFHLAADIEIFEWLYFRTGAQYSYGLTTLGTRLSEEAAEDTERDTTFSRTRGSQFGWRAGIGIEVDSFTLDGVFQDGFVTGGPDFLGGTGGGMFSMVTAGYQF